MSETKKIYPITTVIPGAPMLVNTGESFYIECFQGEFRIPVSLAEGMRMEARFEEYYTELARRERKFSFRWGRFWYNIKNR